MVDGSSHKPTEDQALCEGGTVGIAMQTSPSMDPSKNPRVVYEQISLVDKQTYRVTWGGGRVQSLFRGEHAQALSKTPDGKTRYETRHAFGGMAGYGVKAFMGETMQSCLQAAADALKQRAETRVSGLS